MDNLLHSDHPWNNLKLEFKEPKKETNEDCFLKKYNICESSTFKKDNKCKKNDKKYCLIM